MRKIHLLILGFLTVVGLLSFTFINKQVPVVPYPAENLMEPSELAAILKNPSAKQPVIFNVGSMELIKNARKGGLGSMDDGMKEFKLNVSKVDKNQEVVIYCGCCAMDHCPNINPPFEYLKSVGFTKIKILNIKTGLYEDWKMKGYPMN